MDTASPGTPGLSRLKSITLSRRLWPPPRWRTVILPLEFLPPRFSIGLTSDFFGFRVVMSSEVWSTAPRWPGVIGLRALSGIYTPSNMVIVWPGASVTSAFLREGSTDVRGP